MVTRNWYNLFKSQRAKIVIPQATKSVNGVERAAGYYSSSPHDYNILFCSASAVATNPSYPQGICVGSGTTPPTYEDYKLESMITSGISGTVKTTLDDNNDTVWTLTITNSSSADITIGEVGYFNVGFYGAGNSTDYFMYERTVLDTPITIAAGGFGQVTYTIRFNYPTV